MQKIVSLLLCLMIYNSSYAYGDHYHKAINQAIDQVDSNINIGIKIRNLLTGKVVYERNADSYYNFASSLKLITIAALRQYFGNDYRFTNKIWKKGEDYYLDINDPNFSTEDLDNMLKLLKAKSSATLRNFYIVNSTFSLPPIIESKMVEDTKYCYGALITKVHINKNCIKVQLQPNLQVKSKIVVDNKELIPYKIVNNAVTIPGGYKDKLDITIKNDNLLINGALNKEFQGSVKAVTNDNLNYIKLSLQKLLAKNNIKIKGQILYSAKPTAAQEIVESQKNFYQIASYALKVSDDYITDYLLAEFADIYGVRDWPTAGILLKQYVLQNFAINLDKTIIVDGSGISRYNLFTPTQFDGFLARIYQDQNFEVIKLMLARPGEVGTLNKRFQGVNIFAKTGTMSGISSLIGYVFDKNNVPYSFVIVSNSYLGPKLKYAQLEETIIRILINSQ